MNRLVYLGGKEIGDWCLRHLLENKASLGVDVVAVLTSPRGQKIRETCVKHGVPILNSLEDLLTLREFDFLLSVQYHAILKANHIATARRLAINLHMAPLPEYRGCNQFTFAILNGDSVFGTTLHILDKGIDTGAILAERRFPIPNACFVADLHRLTIEHSKALLAESIADILSGRVSAIPQSEFRNRTSSFHRRDAIAVEKEISLGWDEDKIARHIRATYMPGFEPPFVNIAGKRFFVLSEADYTALTARPPSGCGGDS